MTARALSLILVGALLTPLGVLAQTSRSASSPQASSAPRPAPAHPHPAHPASPPASQDSHRPPHPVRFEGLTLGQKLSDLPQCAQDGSTQPLCYTTDYEGQKAPDLSPSIHTVVLYNLPAFLPPVPAGQTPPTRTETDREHRGLGSVIDGRIEEVKIMIPRTRIREAARLLVKTFPHTQVDPESHMLIGENYAIGFGDAADHVVIGLISRVFVETMEKDGVTAPDDGDGDDDSPAPAACPLPPSV